MEGSGVLCRQRRRTQRTRRWCQTLESAGRDIRFGGWDGRGEGCGSDGSAPGGARTERRHGASVPRGPRSAGKQRQEGSGRSDAVRLPARRSLRRVTALARSWLSSGIRPRGRVDDGIPRKPSEPQVRNRAETRAEPEVGGSRRGGGKPRGRNTVVAWQPRPEGAVLRHRAWSGRPRGETEEGRTRTNPRRGWRYRSREGHGLPAPHRERWTRSEGEEAARRIGETIRRAPCRTTRPSGREGGTDREAAIGDDERQGGDREGRPSGDQQGEGGRPPRPRAPAT
jgi:hypothetical protein